ncbi:microcystin-dependent protein [Nocardioides sp. BE266]|uniref:phage tail protein n=1 Tax=Nocardioides sp. BE266 TaxID=2817725 RepID=UPI00285B886C|nr:tail fiber protein [Nocardioides sp. BE266]MDR7252492.1 microcystin-dependent protein [Nocardioides sp. BE266]
MLEPFLGEIQWVSFNFAPKGWALCNGQLLPINQNQALFSLLGTTYGGDGRVNFALPDLRGRLPIGVGQGHSLGERGGEAAHTLSPNEMPAHTHSYAVTDHRGSTGDPGAPTGTAFASGERAHTAAAVGNATFHPSAVSNVGGSQAHLNLQPFLTLNAIIAITNGIFPSQT